jgi:hypothetical protein
MLEHVAGRHGQGTHLDGFGGSGRGAGAAGRQGEYGGYSGCGGFQDV